MLIHRVENFNVDAVIHIFIEHDDIAESFKCTRWLRKTVIKSDEVYFLGLLEKDSILLERNNKLVHRLWIKSILGDLAVFNRQRTEV